MPRPKKWTNDELDKLRVMTERLTFGEIAAKLGMNTSTVQMACNRHGIKGKQRNKRKSTRQRLQQEYQAQPDPFGAAR